MAQYENVQKGRELVKTGELRRFRESLGLTRNAMATMLHAAPVTYHSWEDEPGTRMWNTTAERLGRFYFSVLKVLDELDPAITLADLTPLHMIATQYGLPQEVLLQWYRDGRLPAVDLGILGLWIHKDDEHLLREAA